MILIPQKLFSSAQVQTILREGNVCILQKELTEPLLSREGYASMHVISIILKGEQQIQTYDEEFIRVQAGELLFIPRGMYYITDLLPQTGNFKSLLFYFDEEVIQSFLSDCQIGNINLENAPTHLKIKSSPTLELFAKALLEIYQQQRLQNKSFLNLKTLELLHLLNSQIGANQFATFLFRLTLPQKRNIREFMLKNFDKPLKVEDYAYLTGRSVTSFRRDFKAYFDSTPQRWIKDKRLEKALAILQEKEMSVREVAYAIGYENVSYFIQEFKSKVGQSPKQYLLSRRDFN